MNDRAHTIVGVLPPLPGFPEEADIYLPTAACPLRISRDGDQSRDMHLVSALARVNGAGPGLAGVKADLTRVADALARAHPAEYAGLARTALSAVPVDDDLTLRFRPTLSVLVASAAFLFLSLCSSIGALMLANALRRRRRVAMQAALGAWRGRLFRQFATESLVLRRSGRRWPGWRREKPRRADCAGVAVHGARQRDPPRVGLAAVRVPVDGRHQRLLRRHHVRHRTPLSRANVTGRAARRCAASGLRL